MKDFFRWTQIRNCRKFYKRCYTTRYPVDSLLLGQLEVFGFLEIQSFSKYSSQALDLFKIKFEEEVEISGTIGFTQIQMSISRSYPEMVQKFEKTLRNWSLEK